MTGEIININSRKRTTNDTLESLIAELDEIIRKATR